jgi:hypothetical protein
VHKNDRLSISFDTLHVGRRADVLRMPQKSKHVQIALSIENVKRINKPRMNYSPHIERLRFRRTVTRPPSGQGQHVR